MALPFFRILSLSLPVRFDGLPHETVSDQPKDFPGLSPKNQVPNKGNWQRSEEDVVLPPRIPFPVLESTSLMPSARA